MKCCKYLGLLFLICNISSSSIGSSSSSEDTIEEVDKNNATVPLRDLDELNLKEDDLSLQAVFVVEPNVVNLDTRGKIAFYNRGKDCLDYYRIFTGYALKFLSMHSGTIATVGGVAATICSGINKYVDPNSSIHPDLATAGFVLGTVVTGASLLGSWATQEANKRLAITQKELNTHKEMIVKLNTKVEKLKQKSKA
ncbi:MAG: hypothetical protein JNK42_00335 [Caedimonas sp.]|jgi:hypothetical protein|nr:hypothetical protein [Caedimonas sp.]